MSVYRVGKYWHFSFQAHGAPYHRSTHLDATERNLSRARQKEAEAKKLVREGNAPASAPAPEADQAA